MRSLYVGLAKNSECGFIRPVCIAPSKKAAGTLLECWVESNSEDPNHDEWIPHGVFSLDPDFCDTTPIFST